MKLTGKTMIFKNDYGYSATISNKQEDGSYDRMYISVSLPKGQDVESKTLIDVTDGFLTFYKTKEGLAKPKLVIMSYTANEFIPQEQIEESDLPF